MHPWSNMIPHARSGSNTLTLSDALFFLLSQDLHDRFSPEMPSVSYLHCTVNSYFPLYGNSIITDLSN